MARAKEVLDNPASGERIVFEQTASETNGAALSFEMTFTPSGFVAQEHVHPLQQERHEVIEGTLGLVLAGHRRSLGPGDVVEVPAGTPHRLVSEGPVRARFEVRPALRQEVLIETFAGLGRDGRLSRGGLPSPLQLAVIAREFEPEGYAMRPPLSVQRALFGLLAAIGRRRGLRAWYPSYSDPQLASQGPPADAPRVDTAGYVFIDEWYVAAPPEAVFKAVSDPRTYPEWWQPVYREVQASGPPAVGQTARQHFKGRLPYHLRTDSTTTSLKPPSLVAADVEGDLSGRGVWTLTPTDGGTNVRFDWRVNADKPLLRFLTPLLRPLFRWNHNWAIARAQEGLESYARRQVAAG